MGLPLCRRTVALSHHFYTQNRAALFECLIKMSILLGLEGYFAVYVSNIDAVQKRPSDVHDNL